MQEHASTEHITTEQSASERKPQAHEHGSRHTRWKSLFKVTLLPQFVSFLRLFDGATRALIVVALLLSITAITTVAVGGFPLDIPDEQVLAAGSSMITKLV